MSARRATWRLRRALACFAAVVIVCAAPAPAAAQLGIAVAPDESVAGLSQAEWSQAWWQWAGSQAALVTDGADWLIADLDGQRVADPERHRQATDCFDMGARAGTPYPIYPSAANGYYVMLRPLSVGTHELNFGGVLPSMTQAVTYMLIVE